MRNAIVDGYMRVLPGVQRRMSASLKGFMSRPSLLTKYKCELMAAFIWRVSSGRNIK